MVQFLNISWRRLHVCVLYSSVGTLPTLKQILETKKNEAQIITNASTLHANASVQDLLTTLMSRKEDQTHQCQPPKNKFLGQIIMN